MADRSVTVTLIAKIADYERGMAQATAVTKKFESELGDLRDRARVDLATVGKAADGASHDLEQTSVAARVAAEEVDALGDKSVVAARRLDDVGDEARGASRDLLSLAARIEAAKLALHSLSMEFATSGDDGLTPKIRQARRELAELERVAKTITPAVSKGLLSEVVSGLSTTPLVPVIAGVIIAGAPIIGAAIGAAVAGGAGLAGIAGGLVLAAQDGRVQEAYAGLGQHLLDDLTRSAQPFIPVARNFAESFGDEWDRVMGPTVAHVFENLQDPGTAFGAGLVGFVHELAPGLDALSRAAGPVLTELGAELPGLAASITAFSQSLERAAPGLAQFTGDLVDVTGATLRWIGVLSELGGKLYEIGSLDKIARAARMFRDGGKDYVGVWVEMPPRVDAATQALKDQAAIAAWTKKQMDDLNRSMTEHIDLALRSTSTEIGFEQALDDLAATLKRNGDTLDINTAKGRENAQAVLTGIQRARDMRDATIASGGSLAEANKVYDTAIKRLEKVADKAGITASELHKMAGNYNITVTTHYKTIGTPGPLPGNVMVPTFASGTPSAPPGLAWVGEQGPELMSMIGGERVFPHAASMSMAHHYAGGTGGGSYGGGTTTVLLDVRADDEAQAARIRKQVKILGGGNVQLAYGSGSF